MSEAECAFETALTMQLASFLMPKDRELSDDESLLIVKNANGIARAMMALLCIKSEPDKEKH